jgi:hypothetical protein
MNEVVALIALAGMMFVGVDLVLRSDQLVADSAERVEHGRSIPLETLSHRLIPGFENARAYRLIGVLIIIVAAAFAAALLTGFLGE